MNACVDLWMAELRQLWHVTLGSAWSRPEFRVLAAVVGGILVWVHRLTLKGLQARYRSWPTCFFSIVAGAGIVFMALGAARLHLPRLLSQGPWAAVGVASIAGVILVAPLWARIHRMNYLQSLLAFLFAAAVAGLAVGFAGGLTRAARQSLQEWNRAGSHTRSVREVLR